MNRTPTDDLPAEIAERMRQFADVQTSGSAPWPGVDHAIRRSHRRRVAVTGAALTLTLVASLGGAAWLDRDDHRNLHAAGQTAAPDAQIPAKVRKLGFDGRAGGTLAGDEAFLTGVRSRVAELAPSGGTPDALKVTAKDVLVFWASDLSGARMALVGYQPQDGVHARFTVSILTGRAGDQPSRMTFSRPESTTHLGDNGSPTGAIALGLSGPFNHTESDLPQMVFVLAPKARQVQITTRETVNAAGELEAVDRPLAKQGDVTWVSTIKPRELYMGQLQVDGESTSVTVQALTNDPDADVLSDLSEVALPGTDQAELGRAAHQIVEQLIPWGGESPVFAGTADLGKGGHLTAGVMLSDQGDGQLLGWSYVAPSGRAAPGNETTATASTVRTLHPADALMTAVRLGFSSGAHQAPIGVLAPTGAVQVRIGSTTAPVQNRLGVLYIHAPEPQNTDAPQHSVTIEALDQNGQVIGTAKVGGIIDHN